MRGVRGEIRSFLVIPAKAGIQSSHCHPECNAAKRSEIEGSAACVIADIFNP